MREVAPPDPAAAGTLTPEPRLSTGIKMFLILTLALLPLGLIALFASLQASRTADLEKTALLNVAAGESARNLLARFAAHRAALRLVADSLANQGNVDICARAVDVLNRRGDPGIDFVVYERAKAAPLCASASTRMVRNL